MVRKELEKDYKKRNKYAGTFIEFGTRNAYKGRKPKLTTVLLINVKNSEGKVVTDHLWFNFTKGFRNLWEGGLKVGDIIQFEGRVKMYQKRNPDYDFDRNEFSYHISDYKLSHPTRLKIIGFDNSYQGHPQCEIPYDILWEQHETKRNQKIINVEPEITKQKELKSKKVIYGIKNKSKQLSILDYFKQ